VSPENLKPKRGCRCSHLYSARTHSGVHPPLFLCSQVKQPELETHYLHLMPKIRIAATPCVVFERYLIKNMDKLTSNTSVLRYIAPFSPFESQSTFRRSISPPFLRQANKSSKKPAWNRWKSETCCFIVCCILRPWRWKRNSLRSVRWHSTEYSASHLRRGRSSLPPV
jgi:hypothetical protein